MVSMQQPPLGAPLHLPEPLRELLVPRSSGSRSVLGLTTSKAQRKILSLQFYWPLVAN
jgi:hypothetical protein